MGGKSSAAVGRLGFLDPLPEAPKSSIGLVKFAFDF
jgi:hypothetical protein